MKTETSFAGPQRAVRSNALPHPRATEGQRAAHMEARPSRPAAHEGDGLRTEAIMHGAPPNYNEIAANPKPLLNQSALLQQHPPTSTSSPR